MSSAPLPARFLKRGRVVPPPPFIPAPVKPLLQDGVLVQPLVVPAPCGYEGSIVCDTFQACASAAEQSSLTHPINSLFCIDSLTPALLLLHGGGQSRHIWRSSATALAKTLNALVVTVDLRGHGESFWGEEYTSRSYGQDVDYLLQVSSILRPNNEHSLPRKFVLVGASQGGLSSLYADANSQASAVVLVDISVKVERLGVQRIVSFMGPTSQTGFATVSEAADVIWKYTPHRSRPDESGVRRNLRLAADNRFYWRWDPMFVSSKIGLDWKDLPGSGPIEMTKEKQKAAMAAFLQFIEREQINCYTAASRIHCPCLLIRADSSDVLSVEGIEAFRKVVPHAEAVDVSNAHHMVISDSADAFTSTLVNWIRDALAKDYLGQVTKRIASKL
jgi:pimeloyl-ACP methyl ester carboxylesterase